MRIVRINDRAGRLLIDSKSRIGPDEHGRTGPTTIVFTQEYHRQAELDPLDELLRAMAEPQWATTELTR